MSSVSCRATIKHRIPVRNGRESSTRSQAAQRRQARAPIRLRLWTFASNIQPSASTNATASSRSVAPTATTRSARPIPARLDEPVPAGESRRYVSPVRRPALTAASAIAAFVVVGLGLGVGVGVGSIIAVYSDSEVQKACDAGPKPKRTQPPDSRGGTSVAWLGPQYGGLRFHSVSYGRVARVNYGEPTARDPCSGSGYSFDVSVLTAPRRPETRRRLRQSLGAGVPATVGTRYGCRRSDNPRIALLRTTVRIEVMATTCDQSIAAGRKLRLASD